MKKTWLWMIVSAVVVLAGCQSTSHRGTTLSVGPGSGLSQSQIGNIERTYAYNSDIYLDVAIPVFNPGFPLDAAGEIDFEALNDMDIWPQLRRAEAKRFAIQTRNALQDTKSFGAVSVVPTANTTADIFVLGTILHSDSEIIELEAMVLDSSGEIIGSETFEHQVSEGFFRDAYNQGKNPYEPVFKDIAYYVYQLVKRLPDAQKQRIKDTSLVRYAHYYSPEAFDGYLTSSVKRKGGVRYNKVELTALPAENDPMLKRIEVLRQQDMLFVDRLQDQFDVFDKTTESPYRQWQEETLPEVIRAKEARSERNTKVVVGVLGLIAAATLGNKSNSTGTNVAKTAGALGSAWLLKDAWQANQNLKVASAVIEEMGQGLDIAVSPTVMEFNEQEVVLTGSASQQYEQWKAQLKSMYELETGNIQD
ncbi:hypothetical protein DRW07_01800 [Alteromonas sediminis]|uniref:Uncharacterized protein n=1 Tax=Alteromonas sediminis TaxID=2259342 RepID=A0A3N5Y2M2_9ALTE|nr:hypothetical protein [Alteromonas sediminis]RPJ68167.1 hypothetical protein DRW07_01800 [Alteromonas sediminis]